MRGVTFRAKGSILRCFLLGVGTGGGSGLYRDKMNKTGVINFVVAASLDILEKRFFKDAQDEIHLHPNARFLLPHFTEMFVEIKTRDYFNHCALCN